MNITVQGTHRVRVRPERALLHLMALAESGSRDGAVDDATRTANRLGDELEALSGVEKRTLEPLRVHAWRPSDQNGRLLAERVSAQVELTATFSDFDQLADFTARAGALPGVQVGGVEWSVTDETRDRLEAVVLERAIARARARALAMAASDGAGDVEITDIADPGLLAGGPEPTTVGGPQFRALAAEAAGAGGELNLLPQDVEIFETVHVRFRVVENHVQPRRGH